MAGNTFGEAFTLTTFGESHGAALGGVIDGCPAGLEISIEAIQHELDRRRPGQSDITTPRNEADKVEILSGLFENRTTGMPIGFIIHNEDAHSSDYSELKDVFRPSHADFTWQAKYGIRDYRGGGRSSAREHAARVVGGSVAKQLLQREDISVTGFTSQIGNIKLPYPYTAYDLGKIENNSVRCPDKATAMAMEELVRNVRSEGDSIGGIVTCVVRGVCPGIGEPVFDRLQARLAYAMMSINAAKGFEYGCGFTAATMRGSAHNDPFGKDERGVHPSTNRSGGIQGGVSNGEDIYFNVAFKPTPTIALPQPTVNNRGEATTLEVHGRHDPCVVPRAVPVVEAMAALTFADMLIWAQKRRP